MCYLAREPIASTEPRGMAEPPRSGSLRPRWVAAAGMALVATVAVAALVAAPPAQAPEPAKQATGLVPVATPAGMTTGTVDRMVLPADDDVPTTAGASPRSGHCHESL